MMMKYRRYGNIVSTLPFPILLISVFLILMPLLSYLATSWYYRIPPTQISEVFRRYTLYYYLIPTLFAVTGVGLMFVRIWAYYLFYLINGFYLAYSITLFIYYYVRKGGTSAELFQKSDLFWNSGFVLALLFVILYFLQKEIRSPYFGRSLRGFRDKKRDTIPLLVSWVSQDGLKGNSITENISAGGCLIPVSSEEAVSLPEGSRLNIFLTLEDATTKELVEIVGVVVRFREKGKELSSACGISFLKDRESRPGRVRLEEFISMHYSPRYEAINPVVFSSLEENEGVFAHLYNLSRNGMYVESNRIPNSGEIVQVNVIRPLFLSISFLCTVVWVNPSGRFQKKPGFGARISKVRGKFRFFLWLLFLKYYVDKRR